MGVMPHPFFFFFFLILTTHFVQILGHPMKMFDLAWYLEWEEGEGAPTWGKMWVFIDNPRLCSLFTV